MTLAFVPEAEPAELGEGGRYPEIPTAPSLADELRGTLETLLERMAALPLEQVVAELTTTLVELRALVTAPEIRQMLDTVGAVSEELRGLIAGPELREALGAVVDAGDELRALAAGLDARLEPSIGALQRAAGSIETVAGQSTGGDQRPRANDRPALAALGRAAADQPRARRHDPGAPAADRISRAPPGRADPWSAGDPAMTRRAFLPVLLGAVALAACSGTPPSRYYLMDAGPPVAAVVDGPVVFVDQATVAAYADRSPIVLRRGSTEVAFAEFDAWAEPVGSQITTVITDALGDRFGRANVRPTPGRRDREPDFRVSLEVLRFEIATDGQAMLDARWTLLAGPDERFAAAGRERLMAMPVTADSFDARVEALSATLVGLADGIATAIQAEGAN